MTVDRSTFLTPAHAFLNTLNASSAVADTGDAGLSAELAALVHADDAISALPMDDLVDGLCEYALHADARRSELGQRLIFSTIVESLADSFEPEKVRLYDQLFARIIDRSRRHRSGRAVDALLSSFGIESAAALLERQDELKRRPPFPLEARPRITRVFVPSRITLGADVAVTSIVLQKIARVFPHAECIVFGPAVIGDLLQGASTTTRFVDCPYERHGGLVARLGSWIDLVDAVRRQMAGCDPSACMFVDPDSRLTQLGLLPVVHEDVASFFFEGRGYQRPGLETMGALAAHWLDETLGPHEGGPLFPQVTPTAADWVPARDVARQLRQSGGGHVTAVNLGVGGNARKRIAGAFERDLLHALLEDGGAVVLDRGIGEEVARVEATVAGLMAEGVGVIEMTPELFRQPQHLPAGQLLVCQAGLRPFTALVAASDLYVGYDSAFQHISAALGIPVVDLFVSPPNELFCQRWRPYSKAPVEVVRAAPNSPGADVLARIRSAYRKSRSA